MEKCSAIMTYKSCFRKFLGRSAFVSVSQAALCGAKAVTRHFYGKTEVEKY